MKLRNLAAVLLGGTVIAIGCSSDDSTGTNTTDGGAATGGTGVAADGGVGGTSTGGTATTGGAGGKGGSGGTSTVDGGGTGGGVIPECTTNADCTAPEQCVSGNCDLVVGVDCAGHIFECGDGVDNDGDGLTDMNDRDCLGPCSNNETNFHNCIPGGGSSACVEDCYFDKDSGSGNDTCEWDHTCDPLGSSGAERDVCQYLCESDGCTGAPEECVQSCAEKPTATNRVCNDMYNTQPDTCETYCGPLTPNGCDCFGCCDVLGDGDYRYMGSTSNDTGDCTYATCTLDAAIAKDDEACKKCTPVAACLNTCEHCECCLANTGCQLPPDCTPDAGTGGSGGEPPCPVPLCPTNVQPCGVSCLPGCPTGFYCSTGCCRPIPA
jgi:hypothetical protein